MGFSTRGICEEQAWVASSDMVGMQRGLQMSVFAVLCVFNIGAELSRIWVAWTSLDELVLCKTLGEQIKFFFHVEHWESRALYSFSRRGKVGYFSVVLECSGRKKSNRRRKFADIFIMATLAWILVYSGH